MSLSNFKKEKIKKLVFKTIYNFLSYKSDLKNMFDRKKPILKVIYRKLYIKYIASFLPINN